VARTAVKWPAAKIPEFAKNVIRSLRDYFSRRPRHKLLRGGHCIEGWLLPLKR